MVAFPNMYDSAWVARYHLCVRLLKSFIEYGVCKYFLRLERGVVAGNMYVCKVSNCCSL